MSIGCISAPASLEATACASPVHRLGRPAGSVVGPCKATHSKGRTQEPFVSFPWQPRPNQHLCLTVLEFNTRGQPQQQLCHFLGALESQFCKIRLPLNPDIMPAHSNNCRHVWKPLWGVQLPCSQSGSTSPHVFSSCFCPRDSICFYLREPEHNRRLAEVRETEANGGRARLCNLRSRNTGDSHPHPDG